MVSSQALAAGWPQAAAMKRPGGASAARRGGGAAANRTASPPPTADTASDLAPLVARMAVGDERALADFHERTVGRAYGLALRIVGSVGMAEEVLIDTYHQAWREAVRYDASRGAPIAWLLMMCRSRALDALRGRDPALLHEDPASLVDEAHVPRDRDPADILAAVEANTALHAALGRLTSPQRQMVALAFFRGLTHDEIAVHSGVPLGTVKSQIRRALEAMRQSLAPARGDAP